MKLQLGYLALSLLMTIILLIINAKAKRISSQKAPANLIKLILGWHVFIIALSLTGFIENLDFPPRFVLFTILPAFIFIAWFAKKARASKWLSNMPVHWLIFYQSFRVLIETLFVFSVATGILHQNVTIEGYNYDMIFAFTSLPMTWLAWRGYYKIVLIWNYLGLAVIIVILFLFQPTIYPPEIYGPDPANFPIEFLQYPYNLVPAFLMPSAVFIHVLSITQLKSLLTKTA